MTRPEDVRSALNDALRYWEPRRLIYNIALAAVVVGAVVAAWPDSKSALHAQTFLVLFILAVLANVAYTVAYLPDVILQVSAYREAWLRRRWILLTLGTLMACAIAWLFISGMFTFAPA